MERLNFDSGSPYSATEASIHLARYQLAAPYCIGKRVLDIACGEGYGAKLLAAAGAASIDAVDASDEAVSAARDNFAAPNITYHVFDAGRISDLFAENTFDVVVSLETIEHLHNPEDFLRQLAIVAKENATIILTCPNDLWYYPEPDQGNAHHVRKYSFEEFKAMSMGILGQDVDWGFGAPLIGFGNFNIEWDSKFRGVDYRSVILRNIRDGHSAIIPPEADVRPVPTQSCYFIGIWRGGQQPMTGSVVYPVSMEAMERQAHLASWNAAKSHPDTFREKLENQKNALLGFEWRLEECRRTSDQRGAELAAKLKEADDYRYRSLALTREANLLANQVSALTQKLSGHEALAVAHAGLQDELVQLRALPEKLRDHEALAAAHAQLESENSQLSHAHEMLVAAHAQADEELAHLRGLPAQLHDHQVLVDEHAQSKSENSRLRTENDMLKLDNQAFQSQIGGLTDATAMREG